MAYPQTGPYVVPEPLEIEPFRQRLLTHGCQIGRHHLVDAFQAGDDLRLVEHLPALLLGMLLLVLGMLLLEQAADIEVDKVLVGIAIAFWLKKLLETTWYTALVVGAIGYLVTRYVGWADRRRDIASRTTHRQPVRPRVSPSARALMARAGPVAVPVNRARAA